MTDENTNTRERVSNAIQILGHPHNKHSPDAKTPVQEGTHYEVLASTLWGDYHVPTVVKWSHGETDSFTNVPESKANRRKAKRD